MIICPAIRYAKTYFPEYDHDLAISSAARQLGVPIEKVEAGAVTGFLNHNYQFLTREEGFYEAKAAGQITAKGYSYLRADDTQLHSGHLHASARNVEEGKKIADILNNGKLSEFSVNHADFRKTRLAKANTAGERWAINRQREGD